MIRAIAHGMLLLLLAGAAPGCLAARADASPGAKPPAASRILLRHVRAFDVSSGQMSQPLDILIEGTRISRMGRIGAVRGARQIDCTGKFAVPGLFDCHTHLIHLTSLPEDSLAVALKSFVARGVTQVRDVGGPLEGMAGLSRRIANGELTGPTVFYSGPMLEGSPLTWERFNRDFPGFTVAIDSYATVDSLLPVLARHGACMVKTFNHIEPAVFRHLIEVAQRCSLRVVHDPGEPLFNWIPMDMALDLGVTSIEHAKAPWPVVLLDSLQREHDRLVGRDAPPPAKMGLMMKIAGLGVQSVSEPRLEQLLGKMKDKGAYFCPTLLAMTGAEQMAIEETKRKTGLDSLPPPMLARVRSVTGGMAAASRHFVSEAARQGVPLLVGQDGASPAGTVAEMRLLKECGVSEAEIIRGATIYPARWLGVADRLGEITPGRLASVVVLDRDPLEDIGALKSVFLVLQEGRPIKN